MRLFLLLLATALVLKARDDSTLGVKKLKFPGGFPDGAMFTLYFKHFGEDDNEMQKVDINFYDVVDVPMDGVHDVPAHISLRRDDAEKPVVTNSFKGSPVKEWGTEQRFEQPPGERPPANGWWRVDIYKLDDFRMNIFFNGFWSDIREFKPSLGSIQTMYLISKNVDMKTVEAQFTLANGMVPFVSEARFKDFINIERSDFSVDNRPLLSFPNFPVGSHIEMMALLRASAGAKDNFPALVFKSVGGPEFLHIHQKWVGGYSGYEELYIGGNLCASGYGDLQHLSLSRETLSAFDLKVAFMNGKREGITCVHNVEPEVKRFLDMPFEVLSHEGSLLFFAQHSIPRTLVAALPRG